MCAHCQQIPDGQETIGPPVYAPVLTAAARMRLDYAEPVWDRAPSRTDPGVRAPDRWHTVNPKQILCDHGRPDGMVLCPACQERLYRMLADIPRLVTDLMVHLTKQNRFLERGIPQHPDGEEQPREVQEESPLPWADAASSVLTDLGRAFDGPPAAAATAALQDWRATLRLPHLAEFAGRVSRAFGKAMRVIDVNPYLTLYGSCPDCGKDIRQERVAAGGLVQCPCGYHAAVEEHQLTQLELAADTQMTLTKVVEVLNDVGERTSRQEIENLIYRQGLPREEVPVWRGGRLEKVWHYRLGDVREWRRKRRTG
jgi:hypothetical protein